MNAYAYIAIFGGVFGILPIIWKAKGSHIFLLLCAGNLLSASLAGSLTTEVKDVVDTGSVPLQSIVKGVLLLLPPVLGLIISKGSVKKKKAPYHFLPALAAGVLAYLWFIRVLPFDQFSALEDAELTKQLLRIRDGALVAGILSSLALMWADRPKPDEAEKKGKKKH